MSTQEHNKRGQRFVRATVHGLVMHLLMKLEQMPEAAADSVDSSEGPEVVAAVRAGAEEAAGGLRIVLVGEAGFNLPPPSEEQRAHMAAIGMGPGDWIPYLFEGDCPQLDLAFDRILMNAAVNPAHWAGGDAVQRDDYRRFYPQIRKTVRFLRSRGFKTDSMLCVADDPSRFESSPEVRVECEPAALTSTVDALWEIIKKAGLGRDEIDVMPNYDPESKLADIVLLGLHDEHCPLWSAEEEPG